MTFVARFTARERRRLTWLRIQVERGVVSDFDRVRSDGACDCPLPHPSVGPPNYGPGALRAPPRPSDPGEGRQVPNDTGQGFSGKWTPGDVDRA